MNNDFFKIFAGLDELDLKDKEYLQFHSTERKLSKDQLMLGDYKRCGGIPFVLSGSIRLFRTSETGKDLTLYKISAGEICVLAAVCAYANLEYDFTAEALEESVLCFLSTESFNYLVQNSPIFREFVFSNLADKLIMALNTIEFLQFPSIEDKIKNYLDRFAGADMTVNTTHETIAKDIGSSREVVSRKLKELESAGQLIIKRGKIKLIKKN
jgi:CRP/FNR family transcriptional regulator